MASADLSSLFILLQNSLSVQESLRKDAEAQLEQASTTEGFGMLLLQLAASNSAGTEATVRQAAAVYFKNLINKRYDPYEEGRVQPLSDTDKAQIRAHIVPAVIECAQVVRPQMITACHKMIRADFPKKWPGLVDELYPLITCGINERVISALAIFHEVVSWHGGTNSEEVRGLIHGRVFSVLLGILQAHMDAASKLDKDAMTIVKSIIKSFYAAIQYRFSEHLLLGEAFTNWGTAITHVIQLTPPAEIIALSGEEAEAHPYWKMKKWAVRIHNKIFQRYGCSKLDTFNNPDHMSFARFYMDQVVLSILAVYLSQIQLNLEGRNPFNDRIFCLTIDFLESALRHKKTWAVLEGHVMDLVGHFLFPRLCFSEEDQEMWDEDPEEYVRVKLDPFDELYSPQTAAVSFIVDLIKCRKKSTFVSVLQFINSTLSSAATDVQSLRRKDGALFMLGSISRVLTLSDFKDQVDSVVSTFVLPELSSSHGFLRMRACWVLEQFDEIEYNSHTCLAALQGVLNALTDKDLPVKVAAAGALGALLDNEATQQSLPPYLGKVMEAVLALANEIQLDSIAFVLERLVQMFAEELAPYAVQLCVQLRDTVARNLEGYSNVLDADAEDDNFGAGADKMMAVVGMFKALETLVDSTGKTPELVATMEEIILPLLAMVLDRRIIDVYEEAFELIDSITFSQKTISPALWALFPYIHRAFKDVGADYIQDMQTTLDNMISYGSAILLANESYMKALLDIIKTTMTGEDFSEHDRVYGCKLMESLLLNCRGHVDALLGNFIEYVMPTIVSSEEYSLSVIVHHLEVVINALYYNAPLALRHLEALNLTAAFFTLWFSKAEKFTRVHDKRLIIMSLSQLMAIPVEQLPPFVQQNYRFIMPLFLSAVQTLPKALEERKKLQEEDSLSDSEFEDDFTEEGDYDEIADDGEEEEAIRQVTQSSSSKHLEEEFEFGDSEDGFDDELEEEVFFETPLDLLDMAAVVQQSLVIATKQPHAFNSMVQNLTAEQATFLQSLIPH